MLGIGGGRPLGFGPNRVRSLPDGVAQVLDEYTHEREERMVEAEQARTVTPVNGNGSREEKYVPTEWQQKVLKIGDLCPECGEATLINEEGCAKCYTCGYSQC
jgi:ribonucleoside-diphosphate reductase alpha chain